MTARLGIPTSPAPQSDKWSRSGDMIPTEAIYMGPGSTRDSMLYPWQDGIFLYKCKFIQRTKKGPHKVNWLFWGWNVHFLSTVQQPLPPAFTVDEALRHMGTGRHQFIMLLVCGSCLLSCSVVMNLGMFPVMFSNVRNLLLIGIYTKPKPGKKCQPGELLFG